MRGDTPMYPDFLDSDFPFIETVIDLRGIAPKGNEDNLTPRGIVLPLENDVFVGFDTELLRVAVIWKGEFLSLESMSMMSYHAPLAKVAQGQNRLPKPRGNIMYANGLYPGWSPTNEADFKDPRPRWQDPEELGRGPLDSDKGNWEGIEDLGSGARLFYEIYGTAVTEIFSVVDIQGRSILRRQIWLGPVNESLSLVLNDFGNETSPKDQLLQTTRHSISIIENRYATIEIPISKNSQQFNIFYSIDGESIGQLDDANLDQEKTLKNGSRWQQTISSGIETGEPTQEFIVDEITLPYPNPWKRRIRPVDILFRKNGDAIILTFDGDLYSVKGLSENKTKIQWRRIAAGFNEPQSICLRDNELFVFSRNGITRLVDKNGDGEIDFYSNFCNRFTQSAHTRDYPLSMVSQQDGSFLFVKGGQQGNSPHIGRVLRASPDGKEVSIFAEGLRNGYIEIHPKTGMITASDQQGKWVPSTPLYKIVKGGSYGFEPGMKNASVEIESPLLWIPHRMAQSGIGQVWITDSRAGFPANSMIYIDYFRPSILKILTDENQAAVMAVDAAFETPLLKGAINPIDGLAYFVGFQIWGSSAKRLEGVCRLKPKQIDFRDPILAMAFDEGILLAFPEEANREYSVSSWEYLRSEEYGSGQYKASGDPGTDKWDIHKAITSRDGKAVFLAIKGLRSTMQLEVKIETEDHADSIYFTLNNLDPFDSEAYDFDTIDFASIFRSEPLIANQSESERIVSIERGQELYTQIGCAGCHSVDGSTEGRAGPTFKGLYQKKRPIVGGYSVYADDEYLRESLISPNSRILKGYADLEVAMPSYAGILSDADIESLILFIKEEPAASSSN